MEKFAKSVVLVGNGDALFTALDVMRSNQVEVFGILDDQAPKDESVEEIPYLGKPEDENYRSLLKDQSNHFIAISDATERAKMAERLAKISKKTALIAVHAQAYFQQSVVFAQGVLVAPFCSIGAQAQVGDFSYFLPGVVMEQEAKVGKYCTIASNVVIGRGAVIGDEVFLGAGAIIMPNARLDDGCQVAPNSVVMGSFKEKVVLFGNPAKEMR